MNHGFNWSKENFTFKSVNFIRICDYKDASNWVYFLNTENSVGLQFEI